MSRPEVARRTQGIISYDPGKPIEEVEREYGIPESVKLASNENPLGSSRRALEAMALALKDLNRYPDGSGFYLKGALASKFKLSPDQITLGNGTNEVLENIGKAFLNPDDQAIMGDASFIVFRIVSQICQADSIVVPLKNYTHDLEEMASRVTSKTKLIFIANPNNPTGTAVGETSLKAFLEKVPENVVVVLDEAYAEYPLMEDFPDGFRLIQDQPNLLVLRTFSKVYGLAGIRIGFGAGHTNSIKAVESIREPFNVNSLALVGARAALEDDDHVQKTKEVNASGLTYLYAKLDEMDVPYVPSQANFLLVEVGDGVQVFKELLGMGVIVRPVMGYGLPAHIRVTVGLPGENERFIEALSRILDDR